MFFVPPKKKSDPPRHFRMVAIYTLPTDIFLVLRHFFGHKSLEALNCIRLNPTTNQILRDHHRWWASKLTTLHKFFRRVRVCCPRNHPLSVLTNDSFNPGMYARYMRWANNTTGGTAFVRREFTYLLICRHRDVYTDPKTTIQGLRRFVTIPLNDAQQRILSLDAPSWFDAGHFIHTMDARALYAHGI